jgi:hypothetical protein
MCFTMAGYEVPSGNRLMYRTLYPTNGEPGTQSRICSMITNAV